MVFEVGKTIAGYEIVEVLGGSKTGVAYKVRNVFAQRFEVLKLLSRSVQDDEQQIQRFLREIKVHARLVHPNIVTFYNAREIEGQLAMTTEYVPGVTVAERLENGRMPWREAMRYAADALAALEYAHGMGVVHRGLSTTNLVITPEGVARLGGFGLAKSATDPQLTAVGTVIGALRYISPEQVKGAAVDARSDIYSLGAVLYEMLTGKLPFASKGQFEMMLSHVNEAPKHPGDVAPDVPRQVGDLVAKALEKEPERRFQSAREFREAVEGLMDGQETTAKAAAPAAVNPAVASQATQSATQAAVMVSPAESAPVPSTAAVEQIHTAQAVSIEPMRAPESKPSEGGPWQSLVSKFGIAAAVCVATFLVGSVLLLALLAVTRP